MRGLHCVNTTMAVSWWVLVRNTQCSAQSSDCNFQQTSHGRRHFTYTWCSAFKIRNWSHIAKDLAVLVVVLVGATLQKSLRFQISKNKVSNWIEMKYGKNVHWLTEPDFWFDVTLSRWRPWHLFTTQKCFPSWLPTNRMPDAYLPTSASSWAKVILYVFDQFPNLRPCARKRVCILQPQYTNLLSTSGAMRRASSGCRDGSCSEPPCCCSWRRRNLDWHGGVMLLLAAERRTRRLRQLVVSADDVTVDNTILVTCHQPAVTGSTREAVDVVDCRSLVTGTRLQHHLTWWDVLTAAGANSRRTKHSVHKNTTQP